MALFLGVLAAQAQAALYWGADMGGIARANLDGSAADPKFVRAGSVCGIAVSGTHIYWTISYGDKIGRANLDGTGMQEDFIQLPSSSVPCGIAVDSEHVYWGSRGGDVGRARLDGSEVDLSFLPGEFPCAVAVSETAIYWSSGTEGEIWRTDIDGQNGPELVLDDLVEPCGIALTDSHLYWSEGYRGTIGRANLDGSEAASDFIAGLGYSASVAAHGPHLYWLDSGGNNRSIGRADLDGANVQPSFIGSLGWAYGLAVDDVTVTPRPPLPVFPTPPSAFTLGELRRLGDGTVVFPITLVGAGLLEPSVAGARVTVKPKGAPGSSTMSPGSKVLKVTPASGRGGTCVRRAFSRGLKVKLTLRVRFTETGKNLVEQQRRFKLFKPAAVARRAREQRPPRTISCPVRPR